MPRILQTFVPTLLPEGGAIDVALFGEAPGPRGADQSGIPFWGDRAGLLVYRALEGSGRAQVPGEVYETWDGAFFHREGLRPLLLNTALGNAFPSCPTRDGQTFRAPTDRELKDPDNIERLQSDLARIRSRCPGALRIITLGKRAAFVMERLCGDQDELCSLPHPSAQGLLQAAPGKGRGLRLADLQAAWETRLGELLRRD